MTRTKPLSDPKLEEEDLRDVILISLGSGFPNATAETFHKTGKTDINIRADGKTAFVAECKFWSGKEKFLETINQLLSYLTWHDPKGTVLCFNRNKNLSQVLDQIPTIIQESKLYSTGFQQIGETEFQGYFSHPDDHGRNIQISFMIWDLPAFVKPNQ